MRFTMIPKVYQGKAGFRASVQVLRDGRAIGSKAAADLAATFDAALELACTAASAAAVTMVTAGYVATVHVPAGASETASAAGLAAIAGAL